jgi:TM2 domain-containing membrane protein YozV
VSKFCSKCGSQLGDEDRFCAVCGSPQNGPAAGAAFAGAGDAVTPDKLRVSPGAAAVLSLLVAGLGQMLNGQLPKGLCILAAGLVLGGSTFGFGAPVIWVLSAVDAYLCAKKLAQGQSIGAWSFF